MALGVLLFCPLRVCVGRCVCKADCCKANLCQSAWQLFRPWSCRYAPCGHKGAIDEFCAPLRRRPSRCTVIAFWRTFRLALIALCFQQNIHTSTANSGMCVQHALPLPIPTLKLTRTRSVALGVFLLLQHLQDRRVGQISWFLRWVVINSAKEYCIQKNNPLVEALGSRWNVGIPVFTNMHIMSDAVFRSRLSESQIKLKISLCAQALRKPFAYYYTHRWLLFGGLFNMYEYTLTMCTFPSLVHGGKCARPMEPSDSHSS